LVIIEKVPLDFPSLVKDCCDYYKDNSKKIKCAFYKTKVTIAGDEKYLRMLLNNILKNAIEYANKHILIELEITKFTCILHIHDDGPGIDPEQIDKVKKSFVKGEVKKEDYGLGLAIAERIVHWHRGTLNIRKSAKLQGAHFEIEISHIF